MQVQASRAALASLLAVCALLTGCATHNTETADREQRASVDLQRAGAREASSAAQDRADSRRASSRCGGFLECVITGLLTGEVSPSKR